MNKRPFIIDCDTGTDDAIMIVAALGCEEIEIVGITSVNGNVAEKFTSQNNLDMMDYFAYDTPVCHGAFLPLLANRAVSAGDNVHGKRGLGDIVLPRANREFDPRIASEFIYEEAKKRNGEMELLVTGPMTNIAIAILEHPDLKDYVKRIYFMGGATIGGNVSPTAEYNIWADPESCHTVLVSGIPTIMVGLNVSNYALMSEEDEKKLREYNSKETVLVADILDYQINKRSLGIRGARMHDPLTLAAALYPECLKFEMCHVDTELRGEFTRGHTAADLQDRLQKEKNVSVAVEIDNDKFVQWLTEKIRIAGVEGEERRGKSA